MLKINIEFLIVAYFVSLFVDWIFQSQWQATNKSNWIKSNYLKACLALSLHSLIYTTMTSVILFFVFNLNYNQYDLMWNVLFWSHVIIDSRIFVKFIMRFKGLTWNQINDYQNYGFMHIGIDHRLHEIVLLLLAIFIQ